MNPRKPQRLAPAVLALAGVLLASACTLYNLERKLAPPFSEFFSQVRYIITAEERRIFLELPDADKPAFIEDFWKRRNPDPASPENEFKTEYYVRIQRATELFRGEGQDGWLTDRGRIYILFGPPTERNTSASGSMSQGRCSEVWYYGDFPVVFLDPSCTGTFRLATYDLSALRSLDMSYASALNRAQDKAQQTIRDPTRLFDYKTQLTFSERGPKRVAATLQVSLPYERIWFKSESSRLRTTFEVSLELHNSKKEIVWQGKAVFPIDVSEDDLPAKSGQDFAMTVPVVLNDEAKIATLGQGKDQLVVSVVNTTGRETQKKAIPFE